MTSFVVSLSRIGRANAHDRFLRRKGEQSLYFIYALTLVSSNVKIQAADDWIE